VLDVLEYVRSKVPGSRINLFTNLAAPTCEIIQALERECVQLFVSMDSPHPERLESIRKGLKYSTLEQNLNRIASINSRPFIVFTLQEENFFDVLAMARFARERDFHLIVNTVRRDEGIEVFQRMVKERVEFIKGELAEAERLYVGTELICLTPDQIQGVKVREPEGCVSYGSLEGCPAIDSELCILFDGGVTPCNMFNPYLYGSILMMDIAELRSGSAFQWFKENHRQLAYCQNCACLGGTS